MRLVLLGFAIAGCARGQSALDIDAHGSSFEDAHVYHDAKVQPIDAPHVNPPPDAHTPDAFVFHDAAGCSPVITELLSNPVFDLNPMGMVWTQHSIEAAYPIITNNLGIPEQSAPYKAWMGGFTGLDEGASSTSDELYQDVVIPATTSHLVLTGYYEVRTGEAAGTGVWDTAHVDLVHTNGTPIEAALAVDNTMPTAPVAQTTASWAPINHTFNANVTGQTVRLRFTTSNDITNATSFYFDTLSLKATHCP